MAPVKKYEPQPKESKPKSLNTLKQEYAQLDREILKLKSLRLKLEIVEGDTEEMQLARTLNRYAAIMEHNEQNLVDF